jgi:hypothetical protein
VPAGDLLRRLDSRFLPVLARGAVRLSQPAHRSRVLGGTAVLSVAAVMGTAIWAADRSGAGGDLTVGQVVRVGVATGDSIPAYVRASRAELASLARATPSIETYALVALSEYVSPARLTPIVRGTSLSEVLARVPLPDMQTEIVRLPAQRLPADAEAGMAAAADKKDREARNYRARGAGVAGDGQAERELRRLYETGAAVAQAEASAFRANCACLYAAVVRGTPAALGEITRRVGVRAVDPAPEVQRLERAVFLPPLPEQSDVVRPPTDVGLSEGTPTPSQAPVTWTSQPIAPAAPAMRGSPAPIATSTYTVPADPSGTPSSSPDASGGPNGAPPVTPTPAAPAPSGPAPTSTFPP